MEYVVPLVIVLVIVVVVIVGSRLLGRRTPPTSATDPASTLAKGRPQARASRAITREAAQQASARLTPETHQRVYSYIAQRQVMNAVKEYRKATHMGLGDAAAAVAALAEFPQPTPEPALPEPVVPPADAPLTVEDIMKAAPAPAPAPATAPKPAPGAYRYRAIVSQGDEVREVASTRLNAEIYGRIRQLALSGNYDGAARLLLDHADIGAAEAHEFVAMIGPED